MAYKTEIQVKVDGLAQVKKLEETLTRVNAVQEKINKRAASKIVDIGRVNAETKALTGLNRELERNIALQGKASRGGGGSGGGGGRPGGGGGGGGVNRAESAALGVGFPLLFGGGAGQVLGGLAGSFVGSGFGGQILGAAIGGQIEDAIGRTAELGRALESLDVSALAESTLLVNAELREAIQSSIELGESQKAVEAVAKATLLQTGLFPENISDATNAATLLSNVWDELVGSVSGLVSIVATPFISALTAALNIVNVIIKGLNTVIGFLGIGIKRAVELAKKIPVVGDLIQFIEDRTKGVNEAEEERLFNLRQAGKELEKELALDNELLAIEQRRSAGTDAAAKLNNAQVTRDLALTKLKSKTEDEILKKRKEFTTINGQVLEEEFAKQESLIRQKALNEEIRINRKFQLDEERAGQLALKELEKQRKEIAKEAQEARARETQIAQARIQTQLNELANEQKIFEIRQQTANAELNLQNARYSAESSLLQLQESRMQRRLADLEKLNTNFDAQRELINAIARNRVQQAKVERALAIAQAQQGVRQAEIALQQIRFQVQRINLEIQLQKIKARGEKDEAVRMQMLREINQIEKQNAQLVGVMVKEGVKRVRIAQEIAKEQGKVADNIFRGKVESIEAERVEARRAVNARELAKATGEAADAAGRLNSNMSGGIGSGPTMGRTASTKLKIDPDIAESVKKSGSARNIFELVQELDEAQMRRNKQKEQRAKAAEQERERQAAFSYMNSLNAPSPNSYRTAQVTTVPVRNATTGAPVVNVNTGPVMEFDGSRYVSMADFEKGLASVARSQATAYRSYGGRNYAGVS